MRWDSSRPVPWQRLFREGALYVVIVGLMFLLLFRDRSPATIIPGLVIGAVAYLGVGYAMAKLGVQRKTAAERRAEVEERKAARESGKSGAKGSKASTCLGSTSGLSESAVT